VLNPQPQVQEKLSVYPNPVPSTFNLRWNSNYKGTAYVLIYDGSGKKVKSFNISKLGQTYTDRVYIGTLQPGVFYIEIKMSNGKSIRYKALKK
jgi:hypothetical protein